MAEETGSSLIDNTMPFDKAQNLIEEDKYNGTDAIQNTEIGDDISVECAYVSEGCQ